MPRAPSFSRPPFSPSAAAVSASIAPHGRGVRHLDRLPRLLPDLPPAGRDDPLPGPGLGAAAPLRDPRHAHGARGPDPAARHRHLTYAVPRSGSRVTGSPAPAQGIETGLTPAAQPVR